MKILIKNIKELIQVEDNPRLKVAGKEMSGITTIKDAYLFIENDRISDFGKMSDIKNTPNFYMLNRSFREIDAKGKMVFPSFCDSHTHIVFSGTREIEYIDKIKGLSYEEIARRGGGILNSAKKLHNASENELVEQSFDRLEEVKMFGTGAIEIKSGYGLTVEDELKMLRVIKKLKELSPLKIKSTFLGAHAIPNEYKNNKKSYVDLIINKMLPLIAEENLADYIDVFCDRGFFTVEDTDKILEAGYKYGLRPKIHANELAFSGGIQIGVKHNALSVDHLEYTGDKEIEALKNSKTMPTLLPGTAFFLGMKYPPARKMIDSGLALALASDFNPGSCPSGNMQFILSLACIKLKMTPEEAINATTINSAYAMDLSKDYASIAKGKKANLFITKKIPSYEFMPYFFGTNKIDTVILNGKIQKNYYYVKNMVKIKKVIH